MITIEEDIVDSDWMKRAWDLPPYKSPEFMKQFGDLDHFRTLPVYRYAVEQGTIVNDAWAGKVQKFNPNHDELGRFATTTNAAPNTEVDYLMDKRRSPIEGNAPLSNALATMSIVALNNIPSDEPVKSLLGKIIAAVDGNAPRLDFVHRYGKAMEVNGSDDLRTPHRCYNNSVDVIMESSFKEGSPRVDYVEGYITEHGVPLAHAWNREGDTMVDHTVKDPWNHQYIGLVVPRRVMMDVMTASSFGRTRGEGVIGAILMMKDKKRRDRYLRLLMEANQ